MNSGKETLYLHCQVFLNKVWFTVMANLVPWCCYKLTDFRILSSFSFSNSANLINVFGSTSTMPGHFEFCQNIDIIETIDTHESLSLTVKMYLCTRIQFCRCCFLPHSALYSQLLLITCRRLMSAILCVVSCPASGKNVTKWTIHALSRQKRAKTRSHKSLAEIKAKQILENFKAEFE